MTQTNGFSRDSQRYLDGDVVEGLDAQARDEADRFRSALEDFTSGLRAPGPEVDQQIMAAVRMRAKPVPRRSWLRWMFAPHEFRVRPALLAAASIALVLLGSVVVPRGQSGPAQHAEQLPGSVLVRFELVAPAANEVTLAGSFNNWSPDGIALSKNPATGLWSGTVPLPRGEHQYLFVVDGTNWIADPSAHAQVDDGFGQTNSVIVVGPRGVIRS